QWTPRRVLKRIPRTQDRLFADDTGAAHFFRPAVGVGNDPVAAQKLNDLLAFIRDPYGVVEEPLVLERLRPTGGIARFHLDPHVIGHRFRAGGRWLGMWLFPRSRH